MLRRLILVGLMVGVIVSLAPSAYAGWEELEDTIYLQGPCTPQYSKGYLRSTQYSGSIYHSEIVATWYTSGIKYETTRQWRVKEWRIYRGCLNWTLVDRYYTYHETRERTCAKFRTTSCGSWSAWS